MSIFGLIMVTTLLIGQMTAATTKSWQHSDKMKALESSRASIPMQKNKINDKLAVFDNVQPTQSMMLSQRIGGFENHSDGKRKATPTVNNKLDKIQAGKSFVELEENLPRYDIGPGVNLTLDVPRSIVNVNLDEDYLKDVFQGG